jgi:endonuclease YncB( thermonuclease family)
MRSLGDTPRLDRTTYRLDGIDAPEIDHRLPHVSL